VQARQLWFSLRDAEATLYLRGDVLTYAPISGDPRPISLLRRQEIPLPGDHNVQNAMGALLAALAIGLEAEPMREALRTFEAMPHRLQTIGEIDGVRYVDDSKSTTPASLAAALRTLDTPIVLIAGGRSKGSSFEDIAEEIRDRTKAVVAIGEAAEEIKRAAAPVRAVEAYSMDEAVHRARSLAQAGDTVLLSPGCASFDMFESAEDRGERFVAAVTTLRQPAGA
jgi:UDP-N-acetylmuramoylalanine--D-glutamate ligase